MGKQTRRADVEELQATLTVLRRELEAAVWALDCADECAEIIEHQDGVRTAFSVEEGVLVPVSLLAQLHTLLADDLDTNGPCDHEIGVCWCHHRGLLAQLDLLVPLEARQPVVVVSSLDDTERSGRTPYAAVLGSSIAELGSAYAVLEQTRIARTASELALATLPTETLPTETVGR
jgi:hypothetical protein